MPNGYLLMLGTSFDQVGIYTHYESYVHIFVIHILKFFDAKYSCENLCFGFEYYGFISHIYMLI